jgi:hypothetical protein
VSGTRRRLLLVPLALVGVAASSELPWEEMTESDWVYALATRFAAVDGHRVHYPTPTAELAEALQGRTEHAALRHLAEARRALGDLAGAEAALQGWAEGAGSPAPGEAPLSPERAAVLQARAWDEVARWGADHRRWPLAFRAAQKALPALPPGERRALADAQVAWADAHPDQADPLAVRKGRAEMFPADEAALEDWISALEKAGRLPDAEAALAGTRALSREKRLLLHSRFLADHGDDRRAFAAMDAELFQGGSLDWSAEFRKAYAERVDKGDPSAPERWRAALDRAFDAPALARLSTYFQGQERGDAAADLLRQVELRHEKGLDRAGLLLLARLHEAIDAVPEAFRARLAAARLAAPAEGTGDIAPLARLALRAGGRPLAWGVYNDEPYRWVARLDRTPGFWTGGLSFLLTGQDWSEALARLESESTPDRTFATARLLADELARRAPDDPQLPSLRVAIMERHVERGEGKQALALLPLVESAAPEVADEGRRVALLAVRQSEVPLEEEVRLHRLRLKAAAADGSRPRWGSPSEGDEAAAETPSSAVPAEAARYRTVLEEALSRLELRDRSHRASVALLLGEMDRLPDAEDLWAELASRLEGWNLDDELAPRYERALARFADASWWSRAARWYARRSRQADLRRLAEDIAARFRGSELFARASANVDLEVPEQPRVGTRVRLVPWADWVRVKALERFPHSPTVVREAVGHLLTRSAWEKLRAERGEESLAREPVHPAVVEDALLETRQWAILFVDASSRDAHLARAAAAGTLQASLEAMETQAERTPVQDLLLFEGWSRLSRFEQAAPFADRLAAAYPGDGALAGRVLSLHRSLAGLDPSHAGPAREVVTRTAPALVDANPLWTELGELEHERGRPQAALVDWQRIVDGDPRNPDRISELATLLWDYEHMAEALAAVEEGRRRIGRPRFFAFETGVLREEVKDVDAAVDEYLAALWPERGDCCQYFEADQRSLRRLAQLLGRRRVLQRVVARIQAMRPGVRADEEAFASFLPLARMSVPEPGLDWTADDWIDAMDMPRDPVGRQQRAEAREAARPAEHEGIDRLTDVMLAQAAGMVSQASRSEFLDAVSAWADPLIDQRYDKDRAVGFKSAIMARRAALAPTEEDRIAREVQRARYLAENGQRGQSDDLWKELSSRIASLPDGAARMRAEAEHAGYVERTQGAEAAAERWRALHERYAWSLGLLEDRLAFLARAGRGAEGRRVLASVIPRAASGHREQLLGRLTREALAAGDLPQARQAVEQLLQQPMLDQGQRLYAVHLWARLSFKESPSFDALPLARAEAEKLTSDSHADLYATLAEAADQEKAWGAAVTLWIEALNRRTERDWLQRAARSGDRGGRLSELLGFFDRQRQRSPRDVRWAVAVRDIKRYAHDVPGAIEMAKTAVAVRPEQEDLWREAVDLMVRADRVAEAALYLEGWNRPRAADEGVAGWRSGLYARAGEGDKALAVEQAALLAYAREGEMDGDRREELRERTARAARRMLAYGQPRLAWTLLGGPSLAKVAGTAFSPREQLEIALLTGNFVRLLRHQLDDAEYRSAAAAVLRERGRPESREETQTLLLAQLFPAQGAGRDLDAIFPLVQEAGMESRFRFAVARRVAEAAGGPWQPAPTVSFLESVGQSAIGAIAQADGSRRWTLLDPDLDALWVRELARRDDGPALVAFLRPRWADLIARVRSEAPLLPGADRLAWTAWLDDPQVLAAWTRGARSDAAAMADLERTVSTRREWDRLWVLAARGWAVATLVEAVPAEARTAWFRFWQRPASAPDPVREARDKTLESVALAVGRLVAGTPDAAADPLIAKLRGPGTIGDVLGADPRWVCTEFTPRLGPKADNLEVGEERVFGQRADVGRVPGALWGDRPGEAWYVLEALSRYRSHDVEAPRVPVEVPERAGQSQRAFVAIRMAEALGEAPLALELEEAFPGRAQELSWIEMRLRLFVGSGQRDKAETLLREVVRKDQASLTEARFRALSGLAQDFGLAPPLDSLDPASPLSPGFLAYLFDRRGATTAARFTTKDEVGFRAALASRWAPRVRSLSADQVRYALRRLWAEGAMPLPGAGLRRLGGLWPHAASWLDQQRTADRAAALAALEALPDTAAFEAVAARQADDDVVRRLRLRILLAHGEDARALGLVDERLAELSSGAPLAYEPPAPAPPAEETAGEGEEEEVSEEEVEPAAAVTAPADPLVTRLEGWLAPFREVGRAAAVEDRLRALLSARRAEGPVSIDAWRLALELTPPADRAALLTEVEHAWIRGDWSPEGLGPIVEVLARLAPDEALRWMRRWPATFDYAHILRRARVHEALHNPRTTMTVLADGRRRGLWSSADEIRAFDAWRRAAMSASGPPAAIDPAAWTAALPFWKGKPDRVVAGLGRHLAVHPYDVRAARAALRSADGGEEGALRRAALALDDPTMEDLGGLESDAALLRLRIARGLLASSPASRAAHLALGQVDPAGLARDLGRRRMAKVQVEAALADVARIAMRASDTGLVERTMAVLIDRKGANVKAVRAELRALGRPDTPPAPFRVTGGVAAPYRPRDLTWAVMSAVLAAEEAR